MANSYLNLAFPFISLLLFTVNVIPSHAISPNDVSSSICPKTRNPSFCSSVVKSAGTTDLKSLASYTLNLASTKAGNNLHLAQSLAAKASNPQLKERYSSCSDNYDEAIGDIEEALKNLASGDYNGVNVVTSGVMSEVDDCRDNFKDPPRDPSSLLKNGENLEDICSIILVISNLLLQRL